MRVLIASADVNHANDSSDGASLTPSRTIEEVEALLLADMEALLEASIREELPIMISKDIAMELWRESQAASDEPIISSNDARLSSPPKRSSRAAHAKAQKPKISVRLEELSKPSVVRKFRNQALLAAAMSAQMRTSGSSSGSSLQPMSSSSSGLKENDEQQQREPMEQREEESNSSKDHDAAHPVAPSTWGTTSGEDLESNGTTEHNAAKGAGFQRGSFNRMPSYAETRKARLDELCIGASLMTGAHQLNSTIRHHPTLSSGRGPAAVRHLQTVSEKLLRRLGDEFDNDAVGGGGDEGLVSNHASAASSLMDRHRQSKLLQTTKLGGGPQQHQEANSIQRMRRPSTSEGNTIHHADLSRFRRKSVGGQTPMAARNSPGRLRRNSFRTELSTGLKEKRSSVGSPSSGAEQSPVFHMSFAEARRYHQHRRSLPAIL